VLHAGDDCPFCPPDYDKMLRECIEAPEKLDPWQQEFIESLQRQCKDGMLLNITPKQAAKLKEAYKDVCKD
jgi:hypothetical protein